MGFNNVYNKIASISPYVEVMLRRLYWRNVDKLKKYNPNRPKSSSTVNKSHHVDFEKVIDWLKLQGIGEGDLLLVHSGYGQLECTGLSPEQIIDRLLEFIGPSGTLAMPVIRCFKEYKIANKAGIDSKEIIATYNVKKTLVTSGMLPYTLMQRSDAVTSLFPLNPLCAVGPLAEAMMEHNLDGEFPSPHGFNSSWKFCYDHGVKVCSIGTDIEHHCTIAHVIEEAFGDWYWPDDIWYNHYKFKIIDTNNDTREVVVSNRKNDWGKLYGAEIKVNKDAKKAGALFSDSIDGITVGCVNVNKLFEMRRSHPKKGYPYYLPFFVNVNKMK